VNQLIALTLETLLNQALRWEASSLDALNKLSGKIIQIEIQNIGIKLSLFPDNQGFIVLSNYDGEANVCINAKLFSLLQLLIQREPSLSNNPDITITGKISIAQDFFQFLKTLDIDWEEQAAQWLGDIPAHKLGNLFRQCEIYSNEQFNRLQLNISEYLQEESRQLPTSIEIEDFLNGVDTLRDDLERLEQRVSRLK
jgi:ubiquinone biosynthesis protein UbiJ